MPVRDSLKFIALLKEKAPHLRLADIKQILATMSEEDISRIADGEEPLEVADVRSHEGLRDFELRTKSPGKRQKVVRVTFDGETAEQSRSPIIKTGQAAIPRPTDEWVTINVSDGVEIRINRTTLSKRHQEQIRIAGKLITSMLD